MRIIRVLSYQFSILLGLTIKRFPKATALYKSHSLRNSAVGPSLEGLSCLEIEYDDLTIFRNERWAMGETLVRQVGGFADITLNGAKKKQLEDFEAKQKLCQLNRRSYFVHSENASVGWVGSGGKTLDPAPFVTPTM